MNPDKKAQNIAVAYSIQKKNKKKFAKGGPVDSAKAESRPMPETEVNDRASISRNSVKKPLMEADWTDAPLGNVKKPKIQAKAGPDMVKSNAFTSRIMKPGDHIMEDMQPDGYGKEPKEDYNEDEAMKSGPKVPDMAREHSNGRKAYAKGGSINEEVSMKDAEDDMVEHPEGLESDDDQMSPAEDEYMSNHFAEGGDVDSDPEDKPDKGYGAIIFKAEGGSIEREEDMQPMDEEEMEHHDSVAAAIMAKRDRMAKQASGSKDEDDAEMYAEGGQVDIDENAEEQPNMYESRNKAALKENYDSDMDDVSQPMDSNEHGHELSDEDAHDMIAKIRSAMSKKRQFSK